MAATLDATFFESRLTEKFRVDEGPIELTLVECQRLKAHPGTIRDPFSVIFLGPVESLLPQRTYELRNEGTSPLAIFLVPVGRNADGFLYQAIFN